MSAPLKSNRLLPCAGLSSAGLLLLALGGCVNPPPPADAVQSDVIPAPIANAPNRPDVVRNLSSLSSADTYALPAPIALQSAPGQNNSGAPNQAVTGQFAASAPDTAYRPDVPAAPAGAKGRSRLLNDKAQKYAEFSYILLNQTLQAAQLDAPVKLSEHRAPEDLKPVVLTAVMDSQGRLNEIVINQHSGDLTIDHLFIDACKKGIWSRNPPLGAQDSDGNYRVQVQGAIYSLSFDRYGAYSYETDIGIGLL